MALEALTEVYRITFGVLGAHLKTYESESGWPLPHFLWNEDAAMKVFLGEEALLIACIYPKAAKELIETQKSEAQAYRQTNVYSSGEEEDYWEEEENDD